MSFRPKKSTTDPVKHIRLFVPRKVQLAHYKAQLAQTAARSREEAEAPRVLPDGRQQQDSLPQHALTFPLTPSSAAVVVTVAAAADADALYVLTPPTLTFLLLLLLLGLLKRRCVCSLSSRQQQAPPHQPAQLASPWGQEPYNPTTPSTATP